MPLPNTFGAASARGFGGFNFQTPRDPNFSSVSLLLPGNGTNGAQNNTFLDSSVNNFTITRNGNTTQGSFSPFPPASGSAWSAATNGGSGYFDGSGDYLDLTPGAIGTGDFTLECWVYLNSNSTNQGILDTRSNSNTNGFALLALNTGVFQMADGISVIGSTVAAATGQWYHIAASRASSVLSFYVNGSRVGSTVANSTNFSNNRLRVGEIGGLGQALSGYVSNARYSNTALYSGASITVPTAPLTGGVALLNFTNGAIYDAAAKNDLETVGNAQTSTAQSKWGGSSMYFDGTGDYLLMPSNNALAFGTGDYTIEFWVRHASITGQQTYVGDTPGNTNGPYVYKDSSHKIGLYYTAQILTGTTTVAANTWYFVAVARASGTVRLFVDGTQEASAADTTNLNIPIRYVGGDTFATDLNGYIQDLRITKGVARYTSNFTPPTAPFPVR